MTSTTNPGNAKPLVCASDLHVPPLCVLGGTKILLTPGPPPRPDELCQKKLFVISHEPTCRMK